MIGSFVIKEIWSDDFCERYALVTWNEKNVDLGVYFLVGNNDVKTGDIINGELFLNCGQICDAEQLDNNVKMITHFNSVHDTEVTVKAEINSTFDDETIYCYVNDIFSDLKIVMNKKLSLKIGDIIYVKGLLELDIE